MWDRFLRDGRLLGQERGEWAARMIRQQETREVTETEKESFQEQTPGRAHSGQRGCSESSECWGLRPGNPDASQEEEGKRGERQASLSGQSPQPLKNKEHQKRTELWFHRRGPRTVSLLSPS